MSNPLDFALEILMLRRGRYICVDTMATFGFPPSHPYYCADWTTLVLSFLPPEVLLHIPDLRECLIGLLSYNINFYKSMADAGSFSCHRHIQVLEHIGHGLLSDPCEAQHPQPMYQIVLGLGHCMNMATHIRQYIDVPAQNLLLRCIEMGEALSTLCADHAQACRAACLVEGLGLVSYRQGVVSGLCRPVAPYSLFKAPLCQPAGTANGHQQSPEGHCVCLNGSSASDSHPGASIRPWCRGCGSGEDGPPSPVFIQYEVGQAGLRSFCDPEADPGQASGCRFGPVGDPVPCRHNVAPPIQASAAARRDIAWATAGQRGVGDEEQPRVGQRRRRGDEDEDHQGEEHPRHWRSRGCGSAVNI